MIATDMLIFGGILFVLIHVGAAYFSWKKLRIASNRREVIVVILELVSFLLFAWLGVAFLLIST